MAPTLTVLGLFVIGKSKIKRRIDLMVSPVINLITSSDNLSDVSFHCRALYTKALALILKDPPLRKQCRSNYYFYEAVQIALEVLHFISISNSWSVDRGLMLYLASCAGLP